jgi:hypothetical protein
MKKTPFYDLNEKEMSNELVIGCYNYTNPQLNTNKDGIRPFIKSLRQFNKTCTIIVFMDTCPHIIKKFFDNNRIIYLLGFNENLMFTRFIKYYKIISRYELFNKILMCDMNDVIFQSNPFDIKLEKNRLYCAQEISSYDDNSNSSTRLNSKWIRNTHKKIEVLKSFDKAHYKNKNVICAGTILGDRESVLSYLHWYEMIQPKKDFQNDQGLLNIYAYEYGENKITVKNYKDSLILTLDKINFADIDKNSNGFLINSNGKKYCIIHQIDRCGLKKLKYLKKTILKNKK